MTKTEEYLKILAEGGDAPTDCCMTVTQSLIAQAIDRINNLGGGDIVDLTPYFDLQTFTLDVERVIPLVEEGGHMYSLTLPLAGGSSTIYFSAANMATDRVEFTGIPSVIRNGTRGDLLFFNFAFDATTGVLDPTSLATTPISFETTQNGYLKNSQKLQIIIGGTTYEYDGSNFVRITILDGESMGF